MFSSLLLCVLISLLLKWSFCRYAKLRKRLPPGSMGLPYIGETKHFFSQHPHSFFSKKQERYGDIFKTCILGCPSVMVLKPEAAKMILVTQAHLFKPTYPPSKEKLIGPEAIFFHESSYHARLKKLVQASFPPSVLKGSVSDIEKIVLHILQTRDLSSTVNVLQEMKKYAFEVAMISAFGNTMEVEVEAIKHLYHVLEKGYNSMYLNFPGTPFYRAMKARKSLDEKLGKLIMKRKESRSNCGGLLGMLVEHENEMHNNLTNSQISDNVVGVIFAAHDTTASVLTWLVKYLHDNTQHLEAVTREQEEIRRRILNEDRKLTWEDTRQMPLTSRVIQETLRTASIISFTFREAVEDIEFEGFCIPKGWKVLPVLRSMHYSADFFPQPENFDPSRFEVSPRANTYMPFGTGAHSCPGSELAKLEMFIFVHHFTINYRWKVIEDNNSIEYRPFPVPKGGLPIILRPRNK